MPNEAKGCPKEGQKSPKAYQSDPKEPPLAPKKEFKERLYTQKLPINRTGGRYVINIMNHKYFSVQCVFV